MLLLPEDSPPRRSTIRRLLLYFDGVALPDAGDRALINAGEIVERFAHPSITKVEWGERGLFPRTPEYESVVVELAQETQALQKRDLLRILPSTTQSDPVSRLVSYHAAIANESVVRAAVPDIDSGRKPCTPSTILVGAAIAPAGFKSRYDLPFRAPVGLDEAPGWGALAWLRIGRAIKYLERARVIGLAPFAADLANAQLCMALAGYEQSSMSNDEMVDIALAYDLVDQTKLEKALADLSWAEVLELRRQILPHVSKIRQKILQASANLHLSSESLTEYRKQLRLLRERLESAQAEVDKKWRELGLAILLRGSGAVGTETVLETFVLPTTWTERLLRIVGLSLAAGARLTTEIRQLYTARTTLRESPLFCVDAAVSRKRPYD